LGFREQGAVKRQEARGKRQEARGKRQDGKNNLYLIIIKIPLGLS